MSEENQDRRMPADWTDLPYAAGDIVTPHDTDDKLWQTTHQLLLREYGPERVLLEHARWAFDAVCAENADPMLVSAFFRKVRLVWLWKRPPLPRGLANF